MGEFYQKQNLQSFFSEKKIVNLNIMKMGETTEKGKNLKNFEIKKELIGNYADQPLFKDKVENAKHILKTAGLPKFKNLQLHKIEKKLPVNHSK